MTIEQLYTVKEVAAMFRVNAATVRNWIRKGQIQAMKIGGSTRIPASELARIES